MMAFSCARKARPDTRRPQAGDDAGTADGEDNKQRPAVAEATGLVTPEVTTEVTTEVTGEVTGEVRLSRVMTTDLTGQALQATLGLKNDEYFRKTYLLLGRPR